MDADRIFAALLVVTALVWLVRDWAHKSAREFERVADTAMALAAADQRNRDLDDGIAAFDAQGVTR